MKIREKYKHNYPELDPVFIGDEDENIRKNWFKEVQIPASISSVIEKSTRAIVLVLSGGGMKALAQIGAYREILKIIDVLNNENNSKLNIDAVIGSSGGAFAGTAICSGFSPDELEDKAKEGVMWQNLIMIDINNSDQLLNMKPLEEVVRSWGAKTFNDLKIPEIVISYQLDEGAVLGWGDQPVAPWVRASCSMIYRVSPLKFVDKQDQRVFEMVDASDFAEKWKNPVSLARNIFPEAFIVNIDLSRGPTQELEDENNIQIAPFKGVNPFRDLEYTFMQRHNAMIERGILAVKKRRQEMIQKLNKIL